MKFGAFSFAFLFFLCSVVSCKQQSFAETASQLIDNDTVWVFAHFNVPEDDGEEGYEDYYYFGRIKNSLYHKILKGEVSKGFILMREMCYWNNNEVVSYEDEDYEGESLFRIEHLVKLDLCKKDPRTFEEEEEEASAEEPQKNQES